jgi:hypothetical protein
MSKKKAIPATLFYADTRFEKLARRPGGVEREEALERAQASVDELKTDFADWVEREFDMLNAALAKLSSRPTDKMALEDANRSCAQLRDVGGTMGYELVTFVAKTLCEILDAYIAGAPYDKEVIDCHINALLLAKTEPYRHLRPDEVPEMTDGLLRVVELASIVPDAKTD